MAATRSTLRDEEVVVIRNRELPDRVVLRAIGVAMASALFVVVMALLLGLGNTTAGTPGSAAFTFLEKLFTCVSAFGTVGLDVGVTAQLNRWGQLVLMVGMFVGRIGILLMLSAIYGTRPQGRVGYPREEIYL
jgi:Trk-type K+ transport system membrane component